MEIGETIYVTTGDEFRKWLIKNHQNKKEIWLIQYKKATKKPSINYVEAVEEAICFGWIDGMEKGMDAERYALVFAASTEIELDEHEQGTRTQDDRGRQNDRSWTRDLAAGCERLIDELSRMRRT